MKNMKKINEGAGAGYTVTIAGLKANNAYISRDEKDGDPIIRFSADILPGVVDWSANGYYDSVSSEGVYDSNGNLLIDYDDEDKQVTGGFVSAYFYAEGIEDYGDDYGVEDSDSMYEDHINNILFDGFEIEKMVGAGWIHTNLSNPLVLKNIDVNADSDYDYFHIDEISIECENIVNDINWFFAHCDELEYDLHDEVNESVNNKSNKHINENFTLDDDLRQILRDFRMNIDMAQFYNDAVIDDEYEPSLQRIISMYDPYVEEIIGFITCPDSSYAEQNIKRSAQDNEWENGTEANMVVNFLYDLYDWCERHGLSRSINESKEQLSQSEKMDLWHEGKRDQNLKACGADKLRKNLAICKEKGYDNEVEKIQAELESRGLKENKNVTSKKALYETIMKSIAKEVKKALSENLIKDEFPTDLYYPYTKDHKSDSHDYDNELARFARKAVKKGNKIEIYYQFGKNGPGLTKEIALIGKDIQRLSKKYNLYLGNPHFDTTDDVYDLKVYGSEKKLEEGSWGVKPNQSDTYLDIMDDLGEKIIKDLKNQLEKAMKNKQLYDIYCLASGMNDVIAVKSWEGVLLYHKDDLDKKDRSKFGVEILLLLDDAYDMLFNDEKNEIGWKDEKTFKQYKKELKKQYNTFEKRFKELQIK